LSPAPVNQRGIPLSPEDRRVLASQAIRPSSVKTYSSIEKRIWTFLEVNNHYRLEDLAESEDAIIDFHVFLAYRISTKSIPSTLTVLKRVLCREFNVSDIELPRSKLVRDCARALRRHYEMRDNQPLPGPLPIEMMRFFAPQTEPGRTPSLREAELFFATIMMRLALLRPFDLQNLTFRSFRVRRSATNAGDGTARCYLRISVRLTKTLNRKLPPTLLVERPGDLLCPVRAYSALVGAWRAHHKTGPAVFPPDNARVISCFGQRLSGGTLLNACRDLLPLCYRKHRAFGLYSIRRGGVTDLISAGVNDRLIQQLGRWLTITSIDPYYKGSASEDLALAASLQLRSSAPLAIR
jgi:hypothetical protein